ncbi:PREDICTED: gamma-aminobutyric acid type B receptor subunit 2-like [Priapulus caudatus]|uniref:Gamma-aminobutyric acid type B receptor subunit 2-like n=1 Tax=Priapulus caudatus TaxID=37621 RepID=A0ABM1DVV7_PRICU|nr:PREDICTED: gamma-aminobutyric acid type B receptor subunit 2-like [Priapulus caudatus]
MQIAHLKSKQFHSQNYAVFIPKKDQCDICVSYKHGNIDEETYNAHIRAKDQARDEKARDKASAMKQVTHSEWMKLDGMYFTSIRPGKKAGYPTVHDLRGLEYRSDGQAIKDSKLIAMVGVLLMMNMTVLILQLIIDPPHIDTISARPIVSPHDSDVINQYLIDTCSSKNEVYFMAALYIIQGVLLFGGCFLAYETRKVKVEALNDSQLIGTCIYNAVVLSFMGVAITFILPDNPPVKYGLVSSFIIGGTTFTAFLLFLPKNVPPKFGKDP